MKGRSSEIANSENLVVKNAGSENLTTTEFNYPSILLLQPFTTRNFTINYSQASEDTNKKSSRLFAISIVSEFSFWFAG